MRFFCLGSLFSSLAPSPLTLFRRKVSDRRCVRLGALLSLVLCGSCLGALAQGASFAGVQSTVATGALNAAEGIAADSSGDLFIANSGASQILEEKYSGGSYTESTIGSGLNLPGAIAVDANGNLYIADTRNNRAVK
jgi:NHL repeat